MATLTHLSLDDARRLGALYGLDISAVKGIPAGSVNSNYALSLASGGRVFLRIYEEQIAETARGEARMLDHLASRGVPTPCPLKRADGQGFIAEHAGKAVALFPWVMGDSLCQALVTPEAARQVGEALARVHLAGASFEGISPGRFGPVQLFARIEKLRTSSLTPELARDTSRLEQRLERYRHRVPEHAGLAHGDLFRDNVLFEQGAITALLDFESASRESLPFDLMVTILAWCFTDRLDPDLAHAMAHGYAATRPLPDAERARLYDEGCFAALRFTITRITDFELRPRGSGVYKDYRRFLARLDALDALGPEGLPALLGL